MSRLTRWLCERYLPALAFEKLTAENVALAKKLEAERRRTAQLTTYIRGMRAALRLCGVHTLLKEAKADGRNHQSMDAGVGG
ncbi:MAG: hypothetical protein RSG59_08155, partial [Ruthenibacterium sp.]